MTTLPQSLFAFAICAAVVWFSGARVAYLADTLADRYKLAKSLVGLLLLSLATSLPEVATTLSAAVRQSRDLVLNNLFGGIALQTAILAMSDFWARGAITNYPRKANHALEATLLVLLLVSFAQRIADQSGLGSGFIGVTLLAAATSLPELTTSITAVRIGAYTMAISNIFGSNLIMLVLVFPADLLFREGAILQDASQTVSLALSFGIVVTAIYLVGLIVRRKPKISGVGLDSILVLFTFTASLFAYFIAR